jgi:hypothetical protein
MKIKPLFINYYLILNNKICNTINFIKCKYFNIVNVKKIENNKIIDVYYKYFFINYLNNIINVIGSMYNISYVSDCIINYIIYMLLKIIHMVNMEIKIIQIEKSYYNSGLKKIIIDSNFYSNNLSIFKTIKYINKNNSLLSTITTIKMNYIILKCELHNNEETLNIKHLLYEYRINNDISNTTIKNVFLFNNINYKKFDTLFLKIHNNKFTTVKLNLNDVLNTHLNTIYEMDI